jgi:hypothetical protein
VNTSGRTRTVVTRLTPELAGRLEQEAASQDRSISAEIRVALRQHLSGRPARVHVSDERKAAA